MEKTKRVRLDGRLGALFGREHDLAVGSVAEAVRALGILLPGFQRHLADAPARYAVFVGKENIGAEQLHYPSGRDVIRIVPIPAGSKRAGLFQVVVGVVLVVAGFFTGGSTWGPAMMVLGASMAISGAEDRA
jgi:predicted phage tail protein